MVTIIFFWHTNIFKKKYFKKHHPLVQGCPTFFRGGGTEMKYFIVRATLKTLASAGGGHSISVSNYFIPNFHDSLHKKAPVITAGCMFLACI